MLEPKFIYIEPKNPIGLSAGLEKNLDFLKENSPYLNLGFIEIGTLTNKANAGYDEKTLHFIHHNKAIFNKMGFPNLGLDNFIESSNKIKIPQNCPKIGINIFPPFYESRGKIKLDESAFLKMYNKIIQLDYISYVTLNISSPNSKILRSLKLEHITELLKLIYAEFDWSLPIFFKLSPLENEETKKIVEECLKYFMLEFDGFVISNSIPQLSSNLGGLSGKPLFEKSNDMLKYVYSITKGKVPLIGCGGVFSGKDVLEKIKCGASLVQLCSVILYEGLDSINRIIKEFEDEIKKEFPN